jgi:hypothetical protein
MSENDTPDFSIEVRSLLEERAKARGGAGAYARMQLGLLNHLRRAIDDELLLGTQPNDVAVAIGSIFGFALVELIALKTNNPAFIIGRGAAAYSEQTTNMLVAAAAMTSHAPVKGN